MSEKEGILRLQSSGRWAVCRPRRDPDNADQVPDLVVSASRFLTDALSN